VSWLLRSGVKKRHETAETLMGVSCVVRRAGDDLFVEGRARTRRDADRLKRMVSEMLSEALGAADEDK